MLSGLIVAGIGAVLICICAVVIFLRPPQCPKCHIPLQAVEETVRDLGPYGVQTVTSYECSNCYRDMQRAFIITHVG
jgi:hypothetical protein